MKRFSIPPDILERLHFVAGARTGLTKSRGEGEFTVYEPRNGAVLTKFLAADKQSIDRIASQAHEAQRKWANMPWIERRQILNGAAHLLRRHANEIAEWEVRDNGKPISEAKGDVLSCADTFEFYAGVNLSGEHIPYGGELSGRFAYTRREPFGVVGAIGAVHGALLANFLSQGQVCSNASKVLVQRKVLEQFTHQIVHQTENMRIGHFCYSMDPIDFQLNGDAAEAELACRFDRPF
ncbi:hypothetical protein niasHS_000682 [Heterodera schachtii]|uniref:Aldehyde dehydrogenase domain-containing protein n=1 Tax=Heterodera schachtii TaxID=97005 RepID=A0ABD2K502_HETSC